MVDPIFEEIEDYVRIGFRLIDRFEAPNRPGKEMIFVAQARECIINS